MKKYSILFALPLAILMACQGGASGEEEKAALETKVLAIHDEAMAKMDNIYKLRRKLRTFRDTLEAQQADSTAILPLQQEIDGLNKADEAMMQWMRQYSAPDTLQHEQAMSYLNKELVKIERVQTIMDSTIEAAQATVTKYEQQK
ncbi:hypothetical protein POKO110462_17535 [Pontibacter korlensis]|uniref:Viral A-type inclusion protein n=1 Tax=Pontibacter korlensis TaxID=400092 RepID=A0A0E3ZH60_9BACT|nr:hypothetical protein [Pontibacter korlensis]AKD05354.1 hypothetical protein PKOR_22780 [Pontibacter korlensis]